MISQRLPALDQYGQPVIDIAQFSVATETITGIDVQKQSQELANESNYRLGAETAHRDVEDGPYDINTTIQFVKTGQLLRIHYTWSAANGGEDSNATANKQQIMGTFNTILSTFKLE